MGLSPTTSASSFFSADSELTMMADPLTVTMSEDGLEDEPATQAFTQGSDECEATQPVWSQTQEATQPTSSNGRTKPKPLSETCWAVMIPASPNAGLVVWELKRDHPTPYRIGRNASRSEFHLPARKISSLHAKIWMQPQDAASELSIVSDEGNVIIEDCSSNGVYVEGVKLGKGKKTVLMSGNEISFGPPSTEISEDYRYIFRLTPRNQAEVDPTAAGGLYSLYDVRDQIGKGSFATVKRAIERSTGQMKAVKIMQKKRFMSNPKTWTMLQREVDIIKALDHPNITRYENYFEDSDNIYIVMEFVNGGDLLDYTIKHGGVSEHDASEIARQMCEAVSYLHSRGVCHRDLKPDNVLLTNGENPIVKISDFGLAKMVDNMTFLRTACGTPTYLAPEVVLNQESFGGYSFSVDAWSIGVIVYAILANSTPFEEDSREPLSERMSKRTPDMNALDEVGISANGKDFIFRLLQMNPRQRLSVSDALDHPWLENAKRNQLSSGSVSLLPRNNALPNSEIKPASLVYTTTSVQTTPSDMSFAQDDLHQDSQYRLEQLSLNSTSPAKKPVQLHNWRPKQPPLPDTLPSENSFATANDFTQNVLAPDSQPNGQPQSNGSQPSDVSMGIAHSESLPFGPTSPQYDPHSHPMSLDKVSQLFRVQPKEKLDRQPSLAGSKRKQPASAFSDDSSLSDVSDTPQKPASTYREASLPGSARKSGASKSEPLSKRPRARDPPTPLRQSARLRNRSAGR